ncbi:MAG: hypothetical protein ACYSW3_01950 [Planctomycetota bacterium]|jgi:uncharacterized Zn finger protein
MDNCPKCEQGELEHFYTEVTGEWIQTIVKCNNCGTFYQGDIPIDHLFETEEM